VTLYISAKDVLDMHDNVSGAINWIAYVNRNALNWNADVIDITMEEGETRTFKASISNNGGEKLDYFIEDLPSWLSVDVSNGSLNPISSKELTFTVAKGINIGGYEAAISLRGVNNVQKILPVTLKVTGERPDWSFNQNDYEESMTVVGQIRIEDLPQEDTDDLLAAFVDNRCVGLVSPVFEPSYQTYFVYMQVWGNNSDKGKPVIFKIWDASTGYIYPQVNVKLNNAPEAMTYSGNGVKGSPDAPVIFNAENAIEQLITVNTGWNWVSFNVDSPSLTDANLLMQNVDNGIEIKGQASGEFSRYETGSSYWTNGTLSDKGVNPLNMYILRMSGNNTVAVPGSPLNVDSTAISLISGWNWIGYIPQFNLTTAEALSGANPQVGDLVKSQTDFAMYSQHAGWVGTLEYMRPGAGYMYRTAAARNFKYPKVGILTRSSGDETVAAAYEPFGSGLPASLNAGIAPNYESNLSLVGTVRITSDNLSPSARLIAKVGNECRGIAEIVHLGDRQLFFLPVFSNGIGNETVTFVLENNGREIPLRETVGYRRDAVLGTLEAPVQLTELDIHLKAYPNPFIDYITVSFDIEDPSAEIRIELISMQGAVIYSTVHRTAVAGHQEVSISGGAVGGLTEGTYVIRVILNNSEQFTNIVIKNKY
jgi:hypothetical protein